MKYKIKIDPKTVKPNPDYLKTKYFGLKREYEFTSKVKPITLIDGKDCFITSWFEGTEYNGILIHGITEEQIKKEISVNTSFKLSIKQGHDRQYIDDRTHIFEYKNKKVKCDCCGENFDYYLLLDSDPDNSGYDEYYNGCPVCYENMCCEIEFETIEEYLKK